MTNTYSSFLSMRMFTDPGCSFAWSAEPARQRLRWLYGEQLEWQNSMIVLADTPEEYVAKNFTPEKQAKSLEKLRDLHGMPIDAHIRPHVAATLDACRAYVATRLNKQELADKLLRQLRIASMAGELIDNMQVIYMTAQAAGVQAEELKQWLQQPEVEVALRDDMRAARAPTKVALALENKLAKTAEGQLRYSAPSYQFIVDGKVKFELPGFWPTLTYEAAIANVAPELTKKPNPTSVSEVLQWANEPLATAEVAAIINKSIDETRAALQKVATMQPLGQDGFWSLS